MAPSSATLSLLALALPGPASSIDNGLGLTPPMGWRSWNLYGGSTWEGSLVNQSLLEHIMDGMVSKKRLVDGVPTSLCDLGYCDVGLDDGWQDCKGGEEGYNYHDAEGRPVVDKKRFPDLAAMTAHAHKLGLTAGFYGNNCFCSEQKNPTQAMYEQDVHLMADVFKFDALKLDNCGKQVDLNLWSNLINKTGRKVMIENCHWGQTVPTKDWCPFNFFRTSGDVRASYGSMVGNLLTTVQWAEKGLSRPGCWAYPDMLEVGCQHGPGGAEDRGLSPAEARSHFGAWCIVSSPLTLSHDVNNDTVMDQIWPIIANKEAIAVNQAWAGHSGSPFKQATSNVTLDDLNHDVASWQYFYKPLGSDKVAVLLMNHDKDSQRLHFNFADVPGLNCKEKCEVRDIWKHQDLGASDTYEAEVASHDSAFLVLQPAAAAGSSVFIM